MSVELIASVGAQAIASMTQVAGISPSYGASLVNANTSAATAQQLASVNGGEAFAATGMSFDGVLNSLQTLNTQMISNQESVKSLALGGTDNLHQVLMGMEQTRLGFDLMLAVRNKLLDAYQELMRMQV